MRLFPKIEPKFQNGQNVILFFEINDASMRHFFVNRSHSVIWLLSEIADGCTPPNAPVAAYIEAMRKKRLLIFGLRPCGVARQLRF